MLIEEDSTDVIGDLGKDKIMNTFNGMVSDLDTMLAKSADTQASRPRIAGNAAVEIIK